MSAFVDKLNVENGISKLPPGFRFQPTDKELVFQYLARKIFSYPLPASIIPEIDLLKYNPCEFHDDSDQERYFFSYCHNGNRTSTVTSTGYWKDTGSDKRIICSEKTSIIGSRKTLVFYEKKHPRARRTDWIMHEYHVVARVNLGDRFQQPQRSLIRIGKWSLCHIFLKKRCPKAGVDNGRPRSYNFMMAENDDTYSSSASSCSSCSDSSLLTEVSSDAAKNETKNR